MGKEKPGINYHILKVWCYNQVTGSASRRAVLNLLVLHANSSWVCWPSVESIAKETEMNERTVRRALDWLNKHKLIRRTRRRKPNGEWDYYEYRIAPLEAGALGLTPCEYDAEDCEDDSESCEDNAETAPQEGEDGENRQRTESPVDSGGEDPDPQDVGEPPDTKSAGSGDNSGENSPSHRTLGTAATGPDARLTLTGNLDSPLTPQGGESAADAASPAIAGGAATEGQDRTVVDVFKDALRDCLGDAKYKSWFEDLRCIAVGGWEVVLATSSQVRLDMIEQRYRHQVNEIWARVDDRKLRLAVVEIKAAPGTLTINEPAPPARKHSGKKHPQSTASWAYAVAVHWLLDQKWWDHYGPPPNIVGGLCPDEAKRTALVWFDRGFREGVEAREKTAIAKVAERFLELDAVGRKIIRARRDALADIIGMTKEDAA